MNLLTDESEPELATQFGELAIIAAILLGRDDDTGMAIYCKGAILSRQGTFREATTLLDEAQAYLRSADNSAQLANCLYDSAICYDKPPVST